MSKTPNALVVAYTADAHRFFPELFRLGLALSGLGLAVEMQKYGTAGPYANGDHLTIEGRAEVSGLEMRLFPAAMFASILDKSRDPLTTIYISKRTLNQEPPTHPLVLNNLQLIFSRLIGDAFLSYVERHIEVVENAWGKEKSKWPEAVWQFGWAIRNACAHNGRIRINYPEPYSVGWRGLSYSRADNGRELFFTDITGVELILLMEEMDAVLPITA